MNPALEQERSQLMKFLDFLNIFAFLDPDPQTQNRILIRKKVNKAIQYGICPRSPLTMYRATQK